MKKSIFIIIFIFALLLRIGLISQKDGLFWDEIVNITTSNHVEYYQDRINYFKLNHPYTGKELKQLFLFDDKNDTLQDLKSLRNGTGDVLHTNFYYSVFRIFFHGVDDYNLNEYLIRAGLLNIILFGFSYFFMYKLLNMLFDDKKYVALGLFLAFCNPCAILNTIYFRLYQMQEMLFVMMAYLGVKNYNTSKKLTLKNVVLWSLLTAMILLTGYYAMVYVGLVYLTIMLISRNKDTFKFLSVCAALSVLLVLLVYPSYFDFLIMTVFKPDSTHIATIETVAKTPLIAQIFNMFNYPLTIYKGICSQLLFLYFIIIGLMLCKRPICQSKAMWVITTISVVWGVIVLMTCPYKIIRYVLPVIPLCTIILTWILQNYDSKKHNIFVCIVIILNVFWMGLNTFKDFGGIGFSNIKIDTNDWVFEQNPSLPVYLNSINKDNLVMWITHFPDEQKYIFISSDAEIKDKHFYLIFDTRKKPSFERDEVLKLQRLYSDEVFCIEVLQK